MKDTGYFTLLDGTGKRCISHRATKASKFEFNARGGKRLEAKINFYSAFDKRGFRDAGKKNGESCSFSRPAGAFNGAVLGADDGLSDGKAEATALGFDSFGLRSAVKAFKNVGQVLRGNANPFVLKFHANGAVERGEADANRSGPVGILHGIVQEDEKKLAQESFVADVRNLFRELTFDANAFSASAGSDEGAGFFEGFIEVERLMREAKLAGVGDGESEKRFDDAAELFQFGVDYREGAAIFGRGAGFLEEQFGFALKDREGGAKFVRSVGDKLAKLEDGAFHADEQFVESAGKTAEFIIATGSGEERSVLRSARGNSFRASGFDTLGHLGSFASEAADGFEAAANVPRRYGADNQQAEREETEQQFAKSVEGLVCTAGRNCEKEDFGRGPVMDRHGANTQRAEHGVADGDRISRA